MAANTQGGCAKCDARRGASQSRWTEAHHDDHRELGALGVEVLEGSARNAEEIGRVLGSVAGRANTGLIMMPDPILTISGGLIIDWAATNRVPALYPFRSLVADGGLMCYGVDAADQVRRAAFYIDHILKGESGGHAGSAPTKFELVINLRTAKALGLTVPPALLTSADEGT